jgi:hypothetical protein
MLHDVLLKNIKIKYVYCPSASISYFLSLNAIQNIYQNLKTNEQLFQGPLPLSIQNFQLLIMDEKLQI